MNSGAAIAALRYEAPVIRGFVVSGVIRVLEQALVSLARGNVLDSGILTLTPLARDHEIR